MKESLVILAGVLYTLKERWVPILKAVIIPFVMMVLFDSASDYVSSLEQLAKPFRAAISFIFELISLFVYTYVAVATHRIVILGVDSVPEWGFKSYSPREGMFFFYSVLLLMLQMASFLTIWFVHNFFVFIVPWLFVVYVSLRFSLIFPSCAIDEPISIKESWDITQNQALLLFMATIVWPLLLIIPVFLLIMLFDSVDGAVTEVISLVTSNIIGVAITVILIASLSLAYLRIIEKRR